jgi:uncharacterized protein YdeI (YjbR/CyaY-like superfamily)
MTPATRAPKATKAPTTGEVRFFETGADLRDWLAANHDTADELWVGMYRKATGRPSITWPEVVDEVLCYGWIDGIRRGIDSTSYTNRITPRRKGSNWSAINIRRVAELEAEGRMTDAGRRAFALRDEAKSRIYSYERDAAAFDDGAETTFRADAAAWSWFEKAASSYRKAATYWVTSAKKQETRDRRLAILIEHSANGRQVPPLTPPPAIRDRRNNR